MLSRLRKTRQQSEAKLALHFGLTSCVGSEKIRRLIPALKSLQAYATAFLDLLYPRRCEGCDAPLDAGREEAGRWLCSACLDSIKFIEPPFCAVCGEPYDGAMTDAFRCENCADEKLAFDFAIAGTMADGVVRDLVHRFKYQRELQLRAVLAALLARTLEDPRIQDWRRDAVLVPVPLHPTRKREREYNQAWELCTELARNHGLRRLDALRRLRATTPQASLSRRERQQNLRKAFDVAPEVLRKSMLAGRTVLLVDDVLTTGTTASECARILKKTAGVEKVVVITVARG